MGINSHQSWISPIALLRVCKLFINQKDKNKIWSGRAISIHLHGYPTNMQYKRYCEVLYKLGILERVQYYNESLVKGKMLRGPLREGYRLKINQEGIGEEDDGR